MKKYYIEVVEWILKGNIIKATKFVSPTQVIRATRTRVAGKFYGKNIEITLSFCKPNWLEREFIKDCQKAKEPFPVKKVLIRVYAPKRKEIKRKK